MNRKENIIKSVREHALEASGVVNNQAQPFNRTERINLQDRKRQKLIKHVNKNYFFDADNQEIGCWLGKEPVGRLFKLKRVKYPTLEQILEQIAQDMYEFLHTEKGNKYYQGKNNISSLQFEKSKELTKISGILTSNLRTRKSTNVPYMAFLRLEWEYETRNNKQHSLEECARYKCQECEIPVVFRIDSDNSSKCCKLGDNYHNSDCPNLNPKPTLKKGNRVILEGKFENSKKSNRLSFTCYSYQIINDHE